MGFPPNLPLRVGDWRVDPALDEISSEGRVIKLEPRTMKLLLFLAQHAQEVITPEALLDHVWAGLVVAPSSVYQAVARLRRTLGDLSDAPTYIATVPRKGYRLIAPVSVWEAPAAATEAPAPSPGASSSPAAAPAVKAVTGWRPAAWAAGALLVVVAGLAFWLASPVTFRRLWTHRAPPHSVAVLPFVALGGAPSDEYLGYGLSEDLINSLANVTNLQVAARTSSFLFAGKGGDLRQIRDQLNVDAVLEGSVRRQDGHIRIIAELIDARSGYHLWSQAFEREERQLSALHEEIADAVLEHLDPALTRAPSAAAAQLADSGAAYNEFLRGRYLLEQRTEDGLNQAVSHFRRAIELQPSDALAYAGLADAYALLAQYASHAGPDLLTQARGAAQQALSLSPDLAEAHAALGLIDNQAGNFREAIPHLQRAIALDPHYGLARMWYGRNLFLQGDFAGADRVFEQALSFDPLSAMLQLNAGLALEQLDRLPEASTHARRAIELEPKLASGYWLLAFLDARTGRLSDAVQLFRSATALGLNQAEGLGQLSALYAELGDCASAEQWLRAGRARSPTDWAVLHAGIAERLCAHDVQGLRQGVRELRPGDPSDPAVRASAAFALAMSGAPQQALDLYRALEQEPAGVEILFSRSGLGIGVSHALEFAELSRANGDPDKARALAGKVRERLATIHQEGGRAAGLEYCSAGAFAEEGDQQQALAALARAVDAGWRAADWMERDPMLSTLHAQPQFAILLSEQRQDISRQRSLIRSEASPPG
jgi:TolB-like protein/DNA-binding winged helix-turn-helix (wHTH) protein/Tfp pilus assembly protein PilF